jgi:hypothetical protein
MRKLLLGVAALVSLAAVAPAIAAELSTPPLGATSLNGDNFLECVATNVGNSTREVVFQGFNSEGAIVSFFTFALEPNMTRGFSISEIEGVNFCKFTFAGNARDIRAAIHILDAGGDGIIAALAAY